MTNLSEKLEQLSAAATEAIKTTGYKYFGDYELSKDQWEAVDALVEFARVVTHQLRTGQLVAVQADDATVERVAQGIRTHFANDIAARIVAKAAISALAAKGDS